MRRLVIALSMGALAGCSGMDWDADDKRVGYTREAGMDTASGRVDPVTGDTVTAESPWRMDYEGKTYYFSDRDSYETFRQNPSEYAEPGAEAEVR